MNCVPCKPSGLTGCQVIITKTVYFTHNDQGIVTNTTKDCFYVTQATFMAEHVQVTMMHLTIR